MSFAWRLCDTEWQIWWSVLQHGKIKWASDMPGQAAGIVSSCVTQKSSSFRQEVLLFTGRLFHDWSEHLLKCPSLMPWSPSTSAAGENSWGPHRLDSNSLRKVSEPDKQAVVVKMTDSGLFTYRDGIQICIWIFCRACRSLWPKDDDDDDDDDDGALRQRHSLFSPSSLSLQQEPFLERKV